MYVAQDYEFVIPGSVVHKSPLGCIYFNKNKLGLASTVPCNTTCMPLPIEPFLDVKELQ